MSLLTMKEVIRMTGTTENALRYYNAKGVLPPTVQESGGRRQWLYDEGAVEKLKRLSLLKYIGVSIEDAGAALENGEQYRTIMMKTLEELKRERDRLNKQIFVAQALALSHGADLFSADEEMDEAKATVLNEVIRELIPDNAEGKEKNDEMS